jgi:predicted Zn-dependent protease
MYASASVDEVDIKGASFCRRCGATLEGKGWA